jgi:hypothetical protein
MKLRRRTATLLSTTRIAVVLAVNVQVQQGRDYRSFTVPLLALTGLCLRVWPFVQTAIERWLELRDLAAATAELINAFGIASVVFWNITAILGKSLAFGMGLRL